MSKTTTQSLMVYGATLSLALGCALAWASETSQQARYEDAQVKYEVGHYEVAFHAFAQLADEGHCLSAQLAAQMARQGRVLYPVDFRLEPGQLQRWRQLPGCKLT